MGHLVDRESKPNCQKLGLKLKDIEDGGSAFLDHAHRCPRLALAGALSLGRALSRDQLLAVELRADLLWGRAGSCPPSLDANRDAILAGHIDRHLVAQPALPQEHRAGGGLQINELPVVQRGTSFARRCGHHHGEPRILEPDCARPYGNIDINRTGNDTVGVDVAGVGASVLQHIDPD